MTIIHNTCQVHQIFLADKCSFLFHKEKLAIELHQHTVHTAEQENTSMPLTTLPILPFQDHTLLHNLQQKPPLQDQKLNTPPTKQPPPYSCREQKLAKFQEHKHQNIPHFWNQKHELPTF